MMSSISHRLDILYENGKPENRGQDHKPQLLLYTPTQEIKYHFLLTELYEDQPYTGFGLYSPFGSKVRLQPLSLLPLFTMAVKGKRILFDTTFDYFMPSKPISEFLKTCQELTSNDGTRGKLPYLAHLAKIRPNSPQNIFDKTVIDTDRIKRSLHIY
jgi:hypothetical protein